MRKNVKPNMMRVISLTSAVLGGCGAAEDGGVDADVWSTEASAVGPGTPITVDVRRSLAVTDQPILQRFSFERVMTQLAAESGQPGDTALSLFNQWWDTQNSGPGRGLGAHCDDNVDQVLGTTVNGYPYLCRPAPSEGSQANCDPFSANSPCAYIPVGLFNRFDMARQDGLHCGEYRIVYAKSSGITNTSDRNLLIFEATVMNPTPAAGIEGCRALVQTWANLTRENNVQRRGDTLERLYFRGLGAIPPIVSVQHFGANSAGLGQIRTNQFSQTTTGWSLREFKLQQTAGATEFVLATNKNNAFGGLFDPASTHPNAAAFRAFLPTQVASLAATTLDAIGIGVPDSFNTGQSQASGATASEMRYLERLGTAESSLRNAIQSELTSLGSSLSPDDIVLRAQANSCAGCHRLNNNVYIGGGLTWPSALGFVHVSERETETVAGVVRFRLSDALINAFLPRRKVLIEDFLNYRPLPANNPTLPINGRQSHG
jgi:hypothetical protein